MEIQSVKNRWRKAVTSSSQDVKQLLPVEKIDRGLVSLRGVREPSIVLEVHHAPNFDLANKSEQNSLKEIMLSLLNYLEDPIQIVVRSWLFDPEDYLSSLDTWRKRWPKDSDLREKRLAEYKSRINNLTKRWQPKSRRFFIVVPFVRKSLLTQPTPGEINAQLLGKQNKITSTLSRAGMTVTRLTSDQIDGLLHTSIDPESARRLRSQADPDPAIYITAEAIEPSELLELDLKVEDHRLTSKTDVVEIFRDRMVFRNRIATFMRTLFMPHYNRNNDDNWMGDLLMIDQNVEVSAHVVPIELNKLKRIINRRLQEVGSSLPALEGDAAQHTQKSAEAGDLLYYHDLTRSGNKAFNVGFTISVFIEAEDETAEAEIKALASLNMATRAIEDDFRGKLFKTERAHWRQAKAFLSTQPLGRDWLGHKQQIPGPALAAAWPFTRADRIVPGGYLVGVSGEQEGMKTLQILDPRSWGASHILILGETGGGKSHNGKGFAYQEWLRGAQVVVLDPVGEYRKMAKYVDGQVIRLYPGSPETINIWDLPTGGEENPVQAKVTELVELWLHALGSISQEQSDILDDAILATYLQAGIVPDDPATWDKSVPISSDFHQILTSRYQSDPFRQAAAQSLANRLSPFVGSGYKAFLFDKRTSVNLNNDFVDFDISSISQQEMLPTSLKIIYNHVRNRTRGDETKRKTILVDEGWTQMKYEIGRDFLLSMAKKGRHDNTMVILIMQSILEGLKNEDTRAALVNMITVAIHRSSQMDHRTTLGSVFGLSHEETKKLVSPPDGTFLMIGADGSKTFMRTPTYDTAPIHEVFCKNPNCDRQDLHGFLELEDYSPVLPPANGSPEHQFENAEPEVVPSQEETN